MRRKRDWKLAITSTPMILIYVMVVFCIVAAIRPAGIYQSGNADYLAVPVFLPCVLQSVR